MKQIISTKHLSTLIFMLSIIVAVKLIWTVVSILFLPNTGEEIQKSSHAKKIYFRVKLNNNKDISPPGPIHTPPPVSSMRGYKLLGLYSSKETTVVTIEKSHKTSILSKGEKINGFELISASKNFVIFKKASKEFKLTLENVKNSKSIQSSTRAIPQKSNINTQIVEKDGVKNIPRTLLTSYTKDMDKIWDDVGLAQYKKNGKAAGFKVNFVKKGSDIAKLGLKRGDILKAINAEPLNLGSAMGFFNNINNLENLTLTVERNGISQELEYEIQ